MENIPKTTGRETGNVVRALVSLALSIPGLMIFGHVNAADSPSLPPAQVAAATPAPAGAATGNDSPTRTEVRSPTSTSTKAHTADNVTVTGGAGAGATTSVTITNPPPVRHWWQFWK